MTKAVYQAYLEENYHQPKSQLEPYTEPLKELFKKQLPHTVSQAIEMIDKETGIRLKPSACRAFLKKMGMKCRRCGVVPGKAMEDDKQRQAQQEFHDNQLQPILDEAKQGKRTVLFVDAAHFVMGAFLGMVWCFVRLLLPSASGRKRHNVLGAYDPITHEAITVTNDTCHNNVNPQINLFFMVTFRIKSFLLKLFLSRPGFNAVFVGLNFLISGIEPGGYT